MAAHNNCFRLIKLFMSTINQFIAITGSAILIASCQEAATDQKNIASDSMAIQQPVTDDGNINSQTSTARYVDLKTNQPADLYYDSKKKRTYSANTNEPVDLYVNLATGDTIYGRGRYVVNTYIVKVPDGTYKLDEGKLKVDGDEIKLKSGDQKLKMDEGEMKIKEGDEKYKSEGTEEKMKDEKVKIKSEDGKVKMKKE
jgi:hypothetical protein